jgi:hypothetical protein
MSDKNQPRQAPVSFRDQALASQLAARSGERSLGLTAARDLERYFALLRDTLPTVPLAENEAMLVCDALNGIIIDPHTYKLTYKLIWAQVDDAIHIDRLDRKWDVDGQALVSKLRGLTAAQCLALADAVERFWLDPNAPDALRRVGLVR